jgi:transcriptional regulator with PAS, ATPase and Fis domain
LENSVAGIGFSNLGGEAVVRRVPLLAQNNGRIMPSFGLELARLYSSTYKPILLSDNELVYKSPTGTHTSLPLTSNGKLYLNHFGDVENIISIGFMDLLQAFTTHHDSMDLQSKLVLVAVTAPGISTFKSTPLSNGLPASLIHATVAENLIEQNYLSMFSDSLQVLCVVIMIVAAFLILQIKRKRYIISASILTFALYWILAEIIFISAFHIMPLFYPSLAFIVTAVYFSIVQVRRRERQDEQLKLLLQEQIAVKELRLQEAKSKLNEVQGQLTVSEQMWQTAEERKHTILRLESELADLKNYLLPSKRKTEARFPDVVYSDKSKMKNVLDLAIKVSTDDISVLISGETGTGKELIARIIHQNSRRRQEPFVAVNCGALSETLLDSELFGHEKGSFTGAQARRSGRFEIAAGGTIFLDEITETSQSFQTRLLRVLQERTFERLGGEQTLMVDVRIIAATNKDIKEEISTQRFRSDLFYRLNGFHISIPPLRERVEDIPQLASHFLKKYNYESVSQISDRAMHLLLHYSWPGNVRELENIIRRAAILAQSEDRAMIQIADFPEEIAGSRSTQKRQEMHQPLEVQILEMMRSLKFSHTAISQTAKALGNRDRGTITEYFRGICFEYLVQANFDVHEAAGLIAATNDKDIINKVRSKINEYLENLKNFLKETPSLPAADDKLPAPYQGLSKKYHSYLKQVLEYLQSYKE